MINTPKRNFYSLFFNDLLSDFGDTLYYLALMNYILLLPDNNNIALSIVTLSETIPILFKIVMGHFADKTARKINIIILTQVFRFFLYIIVGIVVSFKPALWIIIIVSFLNILSDLAGQLENSLYLPIEMQLIDESDREKVFASTQSISSTLNIIFKLSGAALVTWISYQTLAFVNSLTFLACVLFMLFIKSQLESIIKASDYTEINPNQNLLTAIREAVTEIKSIPSLAEFLIVISCINGLFSITTPLIVSTISQNKDFIIVNSAATISFSGVVIAVSSILGIIASTTLLDKISLKYILYIAVALLPILFATFILQNIWLCYLLLFILGTTSGSINPKFYGFLMSNLSPQKIGILTGSIGMIIQLGIIISQLSFSMLVIPASTTTISWIYLVISALLIIYLFQQYNIKKQKGTL